MNHPKQRRPSPEHLNMLVRRSAQISVHYSRVRTPMKDGDTLEKRLDRATYTILQLLEIMTLDLQALEARVRELEPCECEEEP